MAREQEFDADKVFNNQVDQLDADFAQAIRDIHDGLSSETGSPVWTGFLASSWKVRRTPIDQIDRVEEHEPWATLKKEASIEFFKTGKSTRPDNPVIDPRFPVNTDYKFREKNIFIGNAAEYAGYASENPVISQFVQGEAGKIIKDNMRDKGKIFVGAKPSSGFGKIKRGSGLRYIEPS